MPAARFLRSHRSQAAAISVVLFCGVALAQQPRLVSFNTVEVEQPAQPTAPAPEGPQTQHAFLDAKNRFLFSTVLGFSAADFGVTRANLASGGKELNPMARVFGVSTPGLVANFMVEDAGVVGLSYLFHRTGHHRLERITPVANLAASAFAIGYGIAHR